MSSNAVKILVAQLLCGTLGLAQPAWGQVARENALAESEDAFGTSVGLESTGIYTESGTRGFSPLDAGNVRIDGIYFDQVSFLTNKLRQTTAIRVGFGAVDTPFVAPTGVVDHRLRSFPKAAGESLTYTRHYYGGQFYEGEMRLPVMKGRVGLMAGFGVSEMRQADGADNKSWGVTLRSMIRVGSFEFAPFYGGGRFTSVDAKPMAVVTRGYLPKVPPRREYLGQDWVHGTKEHGNIGATLKGAITDRLSFRGGLFRSLGGKNSNFTEVFRIEDASLLSSHYVIADPSLHIHSTSGEGLFVWRFGGSGNIHRIFAGFRGRERLTQTGGSDYFDLGKVIHGQIQRIDKPEFEFTEPNTGVVRQSAWLLGYTGVIEGLGHINMGVQKARYRATLTHGVTHLVDRSSAAPWLYNAALMVNITPSVSAYAATQRGLEDSGTAPDNAINRAEQLPAAQSTQYEGGVRWNFGKGQLVLAGFQITKPYFSYDASRAFVRLGDQRHRGVEASLATHFTKRFDMLLGAYHMNPTVSGPGRDAGLVGDRPTGVAKSYAKLDSNYRTDLPGELTLTGTVEYMSSRPATSAPIAHLGGKQLMIPSFVTFDVGTRQVFNLKHTVLALRVLVKNVTDKKAWHTPAPDVLLPMHRRSFMAILSADF